MFTLETIFLYAACALFALGTLWGLGYLFAPERFAYKLSWVLVLAGFVVHTAFLVTRAINIGNLPITNSFEALAFFVWTIAAIYLVTDRLFKVPTLASFLLPLLVLFSICSILVTKPTSVIKADLSGVWFAIHVIFAFLGYGFFAVAFVVAIMYLLQEKQLKSKLFGRFMHQLPSLEILDRLDMQLINLGFPLFTVAIITGGWWARQSNLLGADWKTDPKIMLSLVTWLMYAAIFHIRRTAIMRGRKVAYLTIMAFALVVLTFVGIDQLQAGIHARFLASP